MSADPSYLEFPATSAPRLREALRERRRARPLPPEIIREDYFGHARLRGRVVLVAGTGDYICRAIVAHCAREGAKVVLVYSDDAAAALECERLVRAERGDCLLIRNALADADACHNVVNQAVGYFGHLDVLVNCAGDLRSGTPATGVSLMHSDASRRLSLAALPRLATDGAIINTVPLPESEAGDDVFASGATSEIRAFTTSLAQQAAERGVRVNAIVCGSPASAAATFRATGSRPRTLLKRAAQPADVGPACVFLASADASFITGQTLHVDGGERAGMLEG